MQEVLIKKITGGIMGIKNGTKQPSDVAPLLNKLKNINEGLYEDYLKKYTQALALRKKD